MRIKGVNFGGWFSQIDCIAEKDPEKFPGEEAHINTFLSEKDIQKVKTLGLDHIRLPLDWTVLFEPETLKPKQKVFSRVESVISSCSDRGLNLMLDLHKAPGHDFHEAHKSTQGLFSDPECLEKTKRIWRVLAERFGGYANTMFELLNEPVAESDESWNRIKDDLWATIRAHAPTSTILLGSNLWSSPHTFDGLFPVEDDNVIYVCHFYAPTVFTHQMAPWVSGEHYRKRYQYPCTINMDPAIPLSVQENGIWDKQRIFRFFEPVLRFREKFKAECVCNEFGVYVQTARSYQMAYIRDLLSVLRSIGIGHTYWNYKNLDFGLMSVGEKLHENLPQYQNPGRWDDTLARLIASDEDI